MKKKYQKLIKEIKDYFRKNSFKKAVIGLSGGIDSALSLKLVSDAIGNKNITAILMPERGLTKLENVKDAANLCNKLKVKYNIVSINPFLNQFKKIDSWKQNKDAVINTKARIRAVILYNFANSNNTLVIGTSNKTELKLGYFTKYGDGAVDIEVIGSLYKTEVWDLAKYLQLPERLINKTPSAELYAGQTDQEQIGSAYTDIDAMLKGKKPMTKNIKSLIERNKHKTQTITTIKAK